MLWGDLFSEQELFAIDAWNRQSEGLSNNDKEAALQYLIWDFDYPTHYFDVYEAIKKGQGSR